MKSGAFLSTLSGAGPAIRAVLTAGEPGENFFFMISPIFRRPHLSVDVCKCADVLNVHVCMCADVLNVDVC